MKNLAIKLKKRFSQNGIERSSSSNSRTSSSRDSGSAQNNQSIPSDIQGSVSQSASQSQSMSMSKSISQSQSQRQSMNGANVNSSSFNASKDAANTNTNGLNDPSLRDSAQMTKRESITSSSGDGLNNDGSETTYNYNRVYCKEDLLDQVPSFREVSPKKRKSLFIKKLRLCSVIFDFQNESASENLGKEMKRQILLELVDHVTTNKGWFSEKILIEILFMVSNNLFRALSPSPNNNGSSGSNGMDMGDEDEPTLDCSWPHLQIVYEFLLRFIVSTEPDAKLLKRHLNGPFILNLLNIFRSEDPREREYLKTILHRIYGKFMSLRSFIRKSINNVFYSIIYENERHNGVGELLEILGSIINGFALPLKIEHKKFLRNVLIPLHKVNRLQIFHQQLSYCITQFIDKDNTLSLVIIGGIIKYWPLTSSSKEVLLLNELEEIIEITPINQLKSFLQPIFKRLSKCIINQHFQVAERALFFWNNDLIGTLTNDHKQQIFPIIVPALHNIKQIHWNNTVHSLSLNVTRMLIEIDTDLYTKIANQSNQSQDNKVKRDDKWLKIKEMSKK
mmetsp:Transcript_28928/g.25550  ORF Transcript_28928/g.25550 Transcript_28928/m.25550 type:complete len:563 (-) Transcript_28928:93-1781(-)